MRPRPPSPVSRVDSKGRNVYPRESARNRNAATCEHCGIDLDVGQGRVWWCSPTVGECGEPSHQMNGGPHVTCLDASRCSSRVKAQVGAGKRPSAVSSKRHVDRGAQEPPETSPAEPAPRAEDEPFALHGEEQPPLSATPEPVTRVRRRRELVASYRTYTEPAHHGRGLALVIDFTEER